MKERKFLVKGKNDCRTKETIIKEWYRYFPRINSQDQNIFKKKRKEISERKKNVNRILKKRMKKKNELKNVKS